MSAKLLVFIGVLVAHGALAAGWDRELPRQRVPVAASCVRAPSEMPSFAPSREIYAMANPVAAITVDDEAMQQ